LTFIATNQVTAGSPSVKQAFTLTVIEPPGIVGTPSYSLTEGTAVNQTIALQGYPTPIAIGSITGLPAGLSLASNGQGTALLLTGTPTATGLFTVDFLLSNIDFSNVSAKFLINVT
jgi:hypothetical protein